MIPAGSNSKLDGHLTRPAKALIISLKPRRCAVPGIGTLGHGADRSSHRLVGLGGGFHNEGAKASSQAPGAAPKAATHEKECTESRNP